MKIGLESNLNVFLLSPDDNLSDIIIEKIEQLTGLTYPQINEILNKNDLILSKNKVH